MNSTDPFMPEYLEDRDKEDKLIELKEMTDQELQEAYEEHDCHLSSDSGCEVCEEYHNRFYLDNQ